MEKTIESQNYGSVKVRSCMFDLDGTNLEEGCEITSLDTIFDKGEVIMDFDEIDDENIDQLIELHCL